MIDLIGTECVNYGQEKGDVGFMAGTDIRNWAQRGGKGNSIYVTGMKIVEFGRGGDTGKKKKKRKALNQ